MEYQYISKKQAEFLKGKSKRLNFLCGSVRSGKTYISLVKWVWFVASSPKNYEFLMCGKTIQTLKRNCLGILKELCGDYFQYSLSRKEGSIFEKKIYLEGGYDQKSEEKIRGMTLGGAYLDEAVLYDESFFQMVLSRLSKKGAKLFATTNPDSPTHYLKKNYLDNPDLQIKVWNFQLWDNHFLDPNYVKNLTSEYKGVFYKRYILGEWVLAEGLIYPFFSQEKHVVPVEKRNYSAYYISMDYGIQNATSMGLWGKYKDKYYRIYEYYHSGRESNLQKTDEQYYETMDNLIETYTNPVLFKGIIIDPSAASFIALIRKEKKYKVIKAKNEIIPGIQNCSSVLSKGIIKINQCCENFTKEIADYSWDDKSDYDVPLKHNDHAMDDFRYFVRTVIYENKTLHVKEKGFYKDFL